MASGRPQFTLRSWQMVSPSRHDSTQALFRVIQMLLGAGDRSSLFEGLWRFRIATPWRPWSMFDFRQAIVAEGKSISPSATATRTSTVVRGTTMSASPECHDFDRRTLLSSTCLRLRQVVRRQDHERAKSPSSCRLRTPADRDRGRWGRSRACLTADYSGTRPLKPTQSVGTSLNSRAPVHPGVFCGRHRSL